MNWPDTWTSDDGLAFTRIETGWKVVIVRDLPQRLGEPCSVDLPREGSHIVAGDTLLAIELSKARVEFAAPAALVVCESRNRSGSSGATMPSEIAWSLVIVPENT
ncbi:MAG: hypothetical protein AB8B85_16160 [Paracoccaceae bacterium]